MRLRLLVNTLVTYLVASVTRHAHIAGAASLPSYPLAVKNPWLSAWLPGSASTDVAASKAQFWTGQDLTWTVLARVDGNAYVLFGNPDPLPANAALATTNAVNYTSTHTYFTLSAGGVEFVLDFFSPVWPKTEDLAKQSLPYSYLTVTATVSGGSGSQQRKRIQIASAIDQTWTAQQGASGLTYVRSGNVGYFQFFNEQEIPYTETDSNDFSGLPGTNQATWGKVIFASGLESGAVTYQCTAASKTYSVFSTRGAFSNSSTDCSPMALAAISQDLSFDNWSAWQQEGDHSSASVVFAIGHEREKSINYLEKDFTGYHRTRWPNVQDAVSFIINNYDAALSASLQLDSVLRSKTESVSASYGSQYADICEASIRQSFGALELAVPMDDLSAEPWVFLKEISSDGNLNTVDLIYQSWPIFINLNPKWIIMQFLPILEYIKAGRWPQEFVIHDMGSRYPNATGHDDGKAERMPLFETSALLTLVYTYEQFTGDDTYTQRYSSLWPSWAEFLVENGLYPKAQLISVDAIPASPNQTALAIQSAIGLKAATKLTGNQRYANVADSWIQTIYNKGLGLDGPSPAKSTHFTYNYGASDSWNVLFASYSDVLLNLSTIPQEALDMQSKWYSSQLEEAGLAFAGPEADKGVNWGLTDWNIMTAAGLSDELQQAVVSTTHAFLTNGKNKHPFGTKYYVTGPKAGVWAGNIARSTVGTHLAISALQQGVWSY